MKTKLLLVLLIITNSTIVFSQKSFDIAFHHDTKLLLTGDERGNHAGTLDLLIKLEFPVKKFTKTYLTIFPSFEYAGLHSGALKRYAFGVGFIHKDIFLKKLNLGLYGDYGFIQRMGNNTKSFGLHIELFYKISHRFSLSYIHQIIERTDLEILYNESNHIRPSSFLGFKIHI